MLKKKQYLMTLLIGSLMFFILFIASYYYIKISAGLTGASTNQVAGNKEESVDVLANTTPQKEVTVEPNTQIHLVVIDEQNDTIEDKNIDPFILLGCTKADIKDKFSGYDLAVFNQDEVMLKKVLPSETEQIAYTLGVENDSVCIVKNGEGKQYTKLNVSATNFSRNTYSLLLKEQIKISSAQKDELLSNPNYIEQILQSYQEE